MLTLKPFSKRYGLSCCPSCSRGFFSLVRTRRLRHDNLQGNFSNLPSISLLSSQTPWSGRLLGIIDRDPIICKPRQLQSDLLLSPSIELVCIRRIPPEQSMISLQSWASTRYSSNSTGSLVTPCWFFPNILPVISISSRELKHTANWLGFLLFEPLSGAFLKAQSSFHGI